VSTGSNVYRFGPFELDASRRILSSGPEAVWLPDRHMDVLVLLAAHAAVHAMLLALHGKHDQAARVCAEALAREDVGSAGWLLPVDPLLQITAHHEAWAQTLAILRERAA
jgi:threonine synthase